MLILNRKKIFIFFSLIIFLSLCLTSFSFAAEELEIEYPEVLGENLSAKPILSEYIKYIFHLALMLGGLIAFGALVSGGFRYMSSVGSPSAMDDAKNQITAGFLGLIILLSSYIVLNTINPQLVILKIGKPSLEQGIILNPGANEKHVRISTSNLQAVYGSSFVVTNIQFLSASPPNILEVTVCSETGYKGICQKCAGDGASPIVNPKSISLHWKIPGIELFADVNHAGDSIFYQQSVSSLGKFDNKASSIKFATSTIISYGAILHKDAEWKGSCAIYHGIDKNDLSDDGPINKIKQDEASSLYVYLKPDADETVECTVWLCKDVWCCPNEKCSEGFNPGCDCEDFDLNGNNLDPVLTGNIGALSDEVRSIYIDNKQGKCWAVLTEDADYTGNVCEVFKHTDPYLHDNSMGNCGVHLDFWNPNPCATSLIIIPVKQ
ncbi:hypothetical protein KAS79_03000 [Candidatus Parcubacteria bacterium]|nr:hypothetical protein [Candidatus Parcubacteria bacterium]